jgi:hypothetical protein
MFLKTINTHLPLVKINQADIKNIPIASSDAKGRKSSEERDKNKQQQKENNDRVDLFKVLPFKTTQKKGGIKKRKIKTIKKKRKIKTIKKKRKIKTIKKKKK